MNTTKHTPGPWSAAIHSGYHAITNQQDGSIHTVVPMVYGDGYDVSEANARLIAAAPELLAFLQMIANGGINEAGEAQIETEARALIAKATGQ